MTPAQAYALVIPSYVGGLYLTFHDHPLAGGILTGAALTALILLGHHADHQESDTA